MSSSKKNCNKDSSDKECVLSEFSYVSSSSSNDGKATVSSGGAHIMRESFGTHLNALAFGFLNENVTAGMNSNA